MSQQQRIATAEAKWCRTAILRSNTFNEADRSVEVCWSTGAAVKRYSWDEGYYMEELAVDKKSIRLDRFNAMSLLDTHDNSTMASRLGTVIPGSVRIEGGKAYARLKFSRKPLAEEIMQDVRDGHPLPISVGYKIHRYEKTEGANGQLPVLRAIDWEPLELSAVPIPADAGATSRKESAMPETHEMHEHQEPPPRLAPNNIINERTRAKELRGIARLAGISDDELERAIDDGTTADSFRTRAMETIVARQATNPTFPHADADRTFDNPDFFRSAAVEALLGQIRGQRDLSPSARQVMADGEAAFARRCLERDGRNVQGWSDQRVMRGCLTTSDFAMIAGSVANVRIVDHYNESLSQLPQVFGRRNVPDFNKHTEAFVDWTTIVIDKVNEHGEFKSSYVDEGGETIQVVTWGTIIPLSRQLIVNAAGGLEKMAAMQGKALAAKVNANMANYIQQGDLAGPRLSDGRAVFHSSRANIESLRVTDPSVTATDLMKYRARMAQRKGKGDVIIGVYPKFWVVHPEFEEHAIKTLANVQASAVNDVNPIAGRLAIVSDPRLTSINTSWLVADPGATDGAVQVFLDGTESPHTESKVGFEIDGVKFKIRHDHGLGWLEWRSWTRLDHAQIEPTE